MKSLLALFLLMAGLAQAQGVCTGYSPTGPTALTVVANGTLRITCLPGWANGTGRGYGQDVKMEGVTAWVYCPTTTGWELRWGVRTAAEWMNQATGFAIAITEPDPVASLVTTAESMGWGNLDTPELKALWCPNWSKMVAAKPTIQSPLYVPPPPGPEVWWTPKASTAAVPALTRPTYKLVNGVLSLECITCRVPEYSVCAMETPKRLVGTTNYGLVLGTTDRYSVCVRRP